MYKKVKNFFVKTIVTGIMINQLISPGFAKDKKKSLDDPYYQKQKTEYVDLLKFGFPKHFIASYRTNMNNTNYYMGKIEEEVLKKNPDESKLLDLVQKVEGYRDEALEIRSHIDAKLDSGEVILFYVKDKFGEQFIPYKNKTAKKEKTNYHNKKY